MKRADIPANCFAAAFLITVGLLMMVCLPFVLVAYVLDGRKGDRDV